MTSHEERKALLTAAQELHDLLQSIAPRVRQVVNLLIGAGDELALASADEVSAGTQVTKKNVSYVNTVTGKAGSAAFDLPFVPGKRACSLCREPGHRATNCPNAHKIQEQKRAEVEARPVKKTRAPMTPERKAKAIEALAKARAARGKK